MAFCGVDECLLIADRNGHRIAGFEYRLIGNKGRDIHNGLLTVASQFDVEFIRVVDMHLHPRLHTCIDGSQLIDACWFI